jgi:methylmalonyl-CoA/ethylmalonyl-CoA epimerase
MEEKLHSVMGLVQIGLVVSDVERASAFYRDVMNLPFLFSAPPGLAFLQIGTTRLMLSRPEDGSEIRNSVLYLTVPDINASFQALAGKAEFVDTPHMIAQMPDHQLWMVFLRDTEGNLVGLMEERR